MCIRDRVVTFRGSAGGEAGEHGLIRRGKGRVDSGGRGSGGRERTDGSRESMGGDKGHGGHDRKKLHPVDFSRVWRWFEYLSEDDDEERRTIVKKNGLGGGELRGGVKE